MELNGDSLHYTLFLELAVCGTRDATKSGPSQPGLCLAYFCSRLVAKAFQLMEEKVESFYSHQTCIYQIRSITYQLFYRLD